ncbi:MAG: thermopsin [Candidatus Thermoplasmatota archaeon]|nr:thermopsin [Candidatus Thermoplasmatota archaeon]
MHFAIKTGTLFAMVAVLAMLASGGAALQHGGLITSSGTHAGNSTGNVSAISDNLSPEYNLTSLGEPRLNASGGWSSLRNVINSRLDSSSVPSYARYLPNFAVGPEIQNGNVLPSYTSAPAPMGLSSYGLMNQSGTLVPYTYSTSSFQGTINLSSVQEFYMGSDAPHSFSIQLNSVLNNVTLFGVTGYQYWTQNVVDYSSMTGQLIFVDNIWNFSSPSAVINGNEFHSYNGTVVPGVYYYDIGPTLHIKPPFTLSLYLNTTTLGNRNTVFFNYSISGRLENGTLISKSGSYDQVQFNSSSPGSGPIPSADFQVSGSHLTGTGFIPMDAEFIIGGPGGGSTADFYNISGSMSLDYRNSSGRYTPVGSAYNAGSETGETSSGIGMYYSNHTAYLSSGPSFVEGLWNISNNPGMVSIQGRVGPSNAFVMVSDSGVMDNATAQWAPAGTDGNFDYHISPGNYSMEFFLSYHNPSFVNDINLSSGLAHKAGTISLEVNFSRGIYTPLYSFSNAQLRNLSYAGNGTASSPFQIPGPLELAANGIPAQAQISPVFSRVNDYLYPVFYGIIQTNTTNYTLYNGFRTAQGNSPFEVSLPLTDLASLTQEFDVSTVNFLPEVFYAASNVTVSNSTISGWFSTIVYNNYTLDNVPPVASLMLWNTTHSLIERNSVESQGSGILIYNQNSTISDNYVWNNTFSNYPYVYAGDYYGYAPIGLVVESSGNTIYNNEFTSTIPLVSISGRGANIYNGGNATYTDRFNITRESSSKLAHFNGVTLSGSILNTSYQGGNYFYNYFGNGTVPYNGSGVGFVFNGQGIFNGSINDGYSYNPLTLPSYATNITAAGLPASTETYFDINNAIYNISYGQQYTVYLPNGTYFLSGFSLVSPQVEFVPSTYMGKLLLTDGSFQALGPVMNITLRYEEYVNLTVTEQGLPAGTQWGFSVPAAGEGFELNSNNISMFLSAGQDYEIIPQSVSGYYSSPLDIGPLYSSGTVTLTYSRLPTSISGNFTVIFSESGLAGGTVWKIQIGQQTFSTTNSTMAIYGFENGNYSYSIVPVAGYRAVQSGYLYIDNGNSTVAVTFVKTSAGADQAVYIALSLIGGVAIGSVAVYGVMRRRT